MKKPKIGSIGESVLMLGLGLAAAYFFFSGQESKKEVETQKKENETKSLPDSWKPSPNAKISTGQAGAIASQIKKSINLGSIDWDGIAAEFEKLSNKFDVESVFNAFGKWDGPALFNGNLFEVLAACYNAYGWADPYAKEDLLSIKSHCYEYSQNISW